MGGELVLGGTVVAGSTGGLTGFYNDLTKYLEYSGDGENSDFSGSSGNIIDQLTRAQKRNVETLNNVITNNLTNSDFSGTLRDLQGNPVPKPGGGFWDHKTEMIQSYDSLQGIKRGLEGSLQNPNLDSAVETFLRTELNKANSYIYKIEELFKPFGGIK